MLNNNELEELVEGCENLEDVFKKAREKRYRFNFYVLERGLGELVPLESRTDFAVVQPVIIGAASDEKKPKYVFPYGCSVLYQFGKSRQD